MTPFGHRQTFAFVDFTAMPRFALHSGAAGVMDRDAPPLAQKGSNDYDERRS
jgi:hypothetical protein